MVKGINLLGHVGWVNSTDSVCDDSPLPTPTRGTLVPLGARGPGKSRGGFSCPYRPGTKPSDLPKSQQCY